MGSNHDCIQKEALMLLYSLLGSKGIYLSCVFLDIISFKPPQSIKCSMVRFCFTQIQICCGSRI